MDSISKRAVQAIRERAEQNGTSVSFECDMINVSRKTFYFWENNKNNPQAYFLQQMALAGYDVIYILTGVRSNVK